MTRDDWRRFADKLQLAVENSQQGDPAGGTSGLEIEFNILDSDLAPVAHVGYGPERTSFADYLHSERLPEWARDHFQLEVFHLSLIHIYEPTRPVGISRMPSYD